jgi:hypothetical protein
MVHVTLTVQGAPLSGDRMSLDDPLAALAALAEGRSSSCPDTVPSSPPIATVRSAPTSPKISVKEDPGDDIRARTGSLSIPGDGSSAPRARSQSLTTRSMLVRACASLMVGIGTARTWNVAAKTGHHDYDVCILEEADS